MGLIGQVLQFARDVVEGMQAPTTQADVGGGDTITADHYSPAGVDAPPLKSDYAVLVEVPGGYVVVGYLDPTNAGVAQPGEFRAVGRDSTGAIKGYILISGTGQININGNFTVDP